MTELLLKRDNLVGHVLKTGWTVIRPIGWDPKTGSILAAYDGTGGNFSKAYLVEKDGKQAFLKAIDLSRTLTSENIMETFSKISNEHQFEVEILNLCAGANLDRIVVALDSGQERLGENLQDIVPYLIFELADGDVRRESRKISDNDVKLAWWLRSLHHSAVGLNQLHSKKINHQDLKPSNILSFGDQTGFKIADLGRSTCEDKTGPFDNLEFSGDRAYAPMEIHFGHLEPDTRLRRMACDCYMLGSMIFFFSMGVGATTLFFQNTPNDNLPINLGGGWQKSYAENLPLLQSVFSSMLANLESSFDNHDIGKELVACASQLCNPNPNLRGHPHTRSGTGSPYSLERYVSIFDRLAVKAAIDARRK